MSRGMGKDQIMALINEGAARRESARQVPAPETPAADPPLAPPAPPPQPNPRPPVEVPIIEAPTEEPPAEVPAPMDSSAGLPRRRRVGLRSDPDWNQKTLYLRRSTVAEAVKVADAMGVELSELVEWSLALQVRDETRSPDLATILDRMKR